MHSPWADGPISVAPLRFFDIETTGLRPDRGARITETALVDHRGLVLHGTADPSASGYDAALARHLDALFAALSEHVVVGHHLAFDVRFVAREADRLGQRGPQLWGLDTLALARRANLPVPNHRLGTLLTHFQITPSGPLHTAPVDARATRALFWALIDQLGLRTLREAGVQRMQWAP